MPDWKTHFIFGLFLAIGWLALCQYGPLFIVLSTSGIRPFSPSGIAVLLFLTQLSSLFPDVDINKSKIRGVASLAASLAVSLLFVIAFPKDWYYAPAYLVLLYLVLKAFPTKHRGITHTAGFCVIFSLVAGLAASALDPGIAGAAFWVVVALTGYAMHLALDRI